MDQIAAGIASGVLFLSSLVFTPQTFFRTNVLGETDNQTKTEQGIEDRSENKQERVENRIENKEEFIDKAKERQAEFLKKAKEDRVESAVTRRKLVEEAQLKGREIRAQLMQRQEEIKDNLEQNREELKEKLETIRDERKREIAKQVCEKFASSAQNISSHLSDKLARMSELIGKIETRSIRAAENGRDISSCSQDIATAKAAIESAQAAVNTQAGRTYSCEITDEANLGETIGGVRQTMQSDAKDTRDTVHQARSAIEQALSCIKSVKGIDEDSVEASPEAAQ